MRRKVFHNLAPPAIITFLVYNGMLDRMEVIRMIECKLTLDLLSALTRIRKLRKCEAAIYCLVNNPNSAASRGGQTSGS